MKTKTFKIGEYAKGGIITVEIKKNIVAVIGKEWDYSKGSNKGSDQSGAKEFCRLEVDMDLREANLELKKFLHELTTSYYTDNIMKWIESKFPIHENYFGKIVNKNSNIMEEIDLFEHPEKLPKKVQKLICNEVRGYKECEDLLVKLEKLGYTFESGLDGEPYGLRKLEII